MHCHHCESSVLEGARFCPNCGTRVDASATAGHDSGERTVVAAIPFTGDAATLVVPTLASCESCGAAALPGQTLCPSCQQVFGSLLQSAEVPAAAHAQPGDSTMAGTGHTGGWVEPEPFMEPAGVAFAPLDDAHEAATVVVSTLTPVGVAAATPLVESHQAWAAEGDDDEDAHELADDDDDEEVTFTDAPTVEVRAVEWSAAAPAAADSAVLESPSYDWLSSAPPPPLDMSSVSPSGQHRAADEPTVIAGEAAVPWWERPQTAPPAEESDPIFEPVQHASRPVQAAPPAAAPTMMYIPAPQAPAAPTVPPIPVLAVLTVPPIPVVAAAAPIAAMYGAAPDGPHEIVVPPVPTVSYDYRPVGFQQEPAPAAAAAPPHADPAAGRPRSPAAMPPASARPASPQRALLVVGAVAVAVAAIGVPVLWTTSRAASPASTAAPIVQEFTSPAAVVGTVPPAAPEPATFDDLVVPPTTKPLTPTAVATPARRKKAVTPVKAAPAPAPVVEAPLLTSSAPAVVLAPPSAAPLPPPAPVRVETGPIGQVFDLSQVEVKPQVASRTEPPMPAHLAGQRFSDVVILRVLVSPGGHPAEVHVLRRAKTDAALDRAAVSVVRQWSFTPARRKGQAVSCWYNVGVPFTN